MSLFCFGHLLMSMGSALSVIYISSETLLENPNFSFSPPYICPSTLTWALARNGFLEQGMGFWRQALAPGRGWTMHISFTRWQQTPNSIFLSARGARTGEPEGWGGHSGRKGRITEALESWKLVPPPQGWLPLGKCQAVRGTLGGRLLGGESSANQVFVL